MEHQQSESLNNISTNKQLELKVLREHIKGAERQLVAKKAEIPKLEIKIKSLQDSIASIERKRHKLLQDNATMDVQYIQVRQKYGELGSKLQAQNDEIKEEIKERKVYLKEQEELITDAMEEGNAQLKSIRYQIEELERVKQEAENEIYESKQIQEQVGREISSAARELEAMQLAQRHEESRLRGELDKVQENVGNARLELQSIEEETGSKLAILKGKEESIIARENAIRLRTDELNTRERRINSAEHLYA